MIDKRYKAVVEFYVFECDDDMAELMARSIAKDIDRKFDNQAVLVKLQKKPFGLIKQPTEIELKDE